MSIELYKLRGITRLRVYDLATDELVSYADTWQEVADKSKSGYYVIDQNVGRWPYTVFYTGILGLVGFPCATIYEARAIYNRSIM